MGEVKETFTVWNANRTKSMELDMLVDSGAVLPLLPKEAAEALELMPVGKVLAEMADGSSIELNQVAADFEYQQENRSLRRARCYALVGEVGVEPLLGQVVLEQMDLLIDCKSHSLRYNPDSAVYPKFKLK